MASLPTVSDREVLTSLRNQENLLENIARAITKREEGLTKRDTEVKKDKRTIDDQQEKSTIKKILESFTKMGATRMNAQEIQFKTFEETKLTKNIAQRTGLDIEFIRKSFEEGQKKKDRELLAQTIAGAINGATGGGGVKGMLGAGLFGAGIAALLGGIKNIVTVIGKTLIGIMGPVFSKMLMGIFSIVRAVGGKIPGMLAGAAGGAGSLLLNPLVAAGVAGAAIGHYGTNALIDYYLDERNKEKALREGALPNQSMEQNSAMMEVTEEARMRGEYNEAIKQGYIDERSQKIIANASTRQGELAAMGYAMENIQGASLAGIQEVRDAGIEAEKKAFDKYWEEMKNKLEEAQQKAEAEIDFSDAEAAMEEGTSQLEKSMKDIMELSKEKMGDIGEKLKHNLMGLGSIKDAEGKEMFNVFEGMGGLMQGIYESAMKEYQDLTSGEGVGKGDMNTQVNTTNVLGGQQTPMIFPNANAIDTNPSVGAYLRKNGVIRY